MESSKGFFRGSDVSTGSFHDLISCQFPLFCRQEYIAERLGGEVWVNVGGGTDGFVAFAL